MLKILLKSDSSIFYNVASSILSSVDSSLYKVCPYTTELPPEEDGVTFLACGNALKDMWASSLVLPKNRTLSSLSGTPYEYGKSVLFVTYDPLVTEMDTSTVSKLQWSLRLALRYCESGSTAPKLGDYTYVNDFSEVVSYIETKYKETGKKVAVSCDLETIGLDEYNPTAYIVSISFTVAPGMAHVVHFSSKEESLGYNLTGNALWRQINHILNTDMAILRGANFKFDRRWLRYKWGMKNENYKMDTTIVGSLLNENRSNSLNTHAKIHSDIGGYDDVFNKKIDKSRMDLVDKSVLLPYAGGDTDACYQVSEEFKKQLVSDKKLLRFYAELLHPSVIAFENMEREGVLLDTDYYYGEGGLKEEVLNSIKDIEDRAFSLMTNRLKIKHKGMLLLTRAALIKDFMFTPLGLNLKPKMYTAKAKSEDVKYASTAKKHLLMFQDHPKAIEFIKCIKEFSSASKTLSTYIDGFGDHLRVDGRFHPSYILFKGDYGGGIEGGTNTGRTACKDPALQCLPCWVNVLTSTGYQSILSIVDGYESGRKYKVLTHNGSWREVIGVYRNGKQPLYKVTLASGLHVTCTGNHPILTTNGFVKTERLQNGQECFILQGEALWKASGFGTDHEGGGKEQKIPMPVRLREPDGCTGIELIRWANKVLRMLKSRSALFTRAYDTHNPEQNLHLLEEHTEAVQKSEAQLLQELWGFGYTSMLTLGQFQEFLGRHGYDASGTLNRADRLIEELRAYELQVVTKKPSKQKQEDQCESYTERKNSVYDSVGRGDRHIPIRATAQIGSGGNPRGGTHHPSSEANQAEEAGYKLDTIISITPVSAEDTYDLTIDGSHSFVAEGIVVHNTIPKHTVWSKKLRKGYIAPEGFKVVNWDYSQGELRIAACIANEGNMISAYKHGVDLHLKTGSRLIGIGLEEAQYIKKNHGLSTTVQPSDTLFNLMLKSANLPDTEEGHKTLNLMPKKDLDTIAINIIKVARQNGKAGNFGLLYGMGAAGYKIYARDSYGVDLTDKEAEAARDDFFSLYPRLVEWHNECKNFVKKYKYIRTPLGRIRHLPLATSSNQEAAGTALRQAINAPVQATLSDLGQYSLVKFTEKYGTPHSCRMFLFTHDSLTAYVKEDELDFWVPEVARIMENLPLKEVFGWSPQIKFLSDAEVGDNLANLVEVERTW